MANWVAEVYDTIKEAETAIELLDSVTTAIRVFGFLQGSKQKIVVLTGDVLEIVCHLGTVVVHDGNVIRN